MDNARLQELWNGKPGFSHWRVLAALVLLGFTVRVLVMDSTSLWFDETVTANAAISFLENGVPNLPSGWEYWRAFPYTLLTSVSVAVFGVSDFALRLPAAVIGSLTIPLTYFAGRELFSGKTGLVAAAFITFSAWEVVWSTQARMYILLQFLYLLSILLIYRTGEEPSWKNITALTAAILLAVFTHVTAYILPFIAVLYIVYRNRDSLDRRLLSLLLLPVSAAVIGQVFYYGYPGLVDRLVFSPGNFPRYLGWMALNAAVVAFLGFTGLILNIREDFDTALLMGLAAFPAFYVYSFHVDGFATRYIYFLVPFLALWAGVSVEKLAAHLFPRHLTERQALTALTVSLLLVSTGLGYAAGQDAYRPIEDHASAYDYVESRSTPDDVLITQWTSPAVYYYRPPDYSLFGQRFNASDYSFKGREAYSGASFIEGEEELEKVIRENDRGWLVLQDSAYGTKPSGMQDLISSLYLEASYPGIRVWSWNESYPTN